MPGGTINADALRLQDDAVSLVRAFTAAGKPVAAICHGPWALVEAAAVEGKTLTSYASLETDVLNAGGAWVDRSVVRDDEGTRSSRRATRGPRRLPARGGRGPGRVTRTVRAG